MSTKGNHDYSYVEIIEKVSENKLHDKYSEVLAAANRFIEEAGYQGHVECNERILMNLLLDYFADLFRQKDFHGIEWVRTEKTFAYLISWIVRRKPLQFIHYTDDEKDIFVNERFAAFLMLNECMLCGTKKFIGKENQAKLDEYISLLFYYLKYRECNPQVIELAIESFKMGMLVS